jgi:hypothetical protein
LILGVLNHVKNLKYNKELLLLLKDPDCLEEKDALEYAALEKNRYIFWVEWRTPNVHRYDTALERWQDIRITNLDDFMELEGNTSWGFNWD